MLALVVLIDENDLTYISESMVTFFIPHQHVADSDENSEKQDEGYLEMRWDSFFKIFPFSM